VISTLEVAVVPTSQGPVASEGFIMALAAKIRFTEGTTAAAHRQEPVRGPKKKPWYSEVTRSTILSIFNDLSISRRYINNMYVVYIIIYIYIIVY
jgi:hypothetical protein